MVEVRPIRDEEMDAAAALLAEVLNDKRIAILGKASGWVDVVRALLIEYDGLILVAIEGNKMVGSAVYRVKDLEIGKGVARVIISKIGIIKALLAKRRLEKLASSLPEIEEGEAELDALGVMEGHRKKGVATALMEKGEQWARKSGAKRVCLSMKEDNKPAYQLYTKNGFSVHSKYTNAWGHNLYLKKDL